MLLAQIFAIAIFLLMFLLIIIDKTEHYVITLACGAATFVIVFGLCMHSLQAMTKTLNIAGIFTKGFWYEAGESFESSGGINWATIIFIACMMVMVEGMARSGFFHWLCLTIVRAVRYKVFPIFISFMVISAVLAMFIDSITVILFLAAATTELARLLEFNPVPIILSEIFCANLGGSATMCGDPPNIIIGTSLGYTFSDFISNTGLIAGISLVAVVIYFSIVFRGQLKQGGTAQSHNNCPAPKTAIKSKKSFAASIVIFLCAVVLLVTHAKTGLTVALIGVIIAAATLLAAGKNALSVLKKVDYKTILFFVGLFMVVGGLEQTGILEIIADFIGKISGGNAMLAAVIILWISAIASAFVDNIPFSATMIPIIKSLSASMGVDLSVLAWALSMGTDVGGSATPIGASANVVGTSVAAKAGYPISWGKYCKTAAPATAIVLVISMICIIVRYF